MTDRLDERIFQMADADGYDAARYEQKLKRTLCALPDAQSAAPDAARQRERGRAKRRAGRMGRRTLVLAAALALAACTAMAAARLGFLDFAQHYDPRTGGDLTGLVVEGTLASCETDGVRYEVRAASCDGKELQLVVAAMPKDPARVLVEPDAGDVEYAEAEKLAPNLRHAEFHLTDADASLDTGAMGFWAQREDRGLVFGATVDDLNIEPGKELTLTLLCRDYEAGLTDLQEARMTFTFTAAVPETTAYDVDADLGSVRVTRVEVSHTALALHVTVTYDPLTDREPNFHFVSADGSTQWGMSGGRGQDGVYRARGAFATTQEMPKTLLLWPYSEKDDCDRALLIDTGTGAAQAVPVLPALDAEGEIRVTRETPSEDGGTKR